MNESRADAKAIFFQALDCQTPDELARFLQTACEGDDELHARVSELLDAHRDAGKFLDGGGSGDTNEFEPLAEGQGTVVGPYKLLEQIGEGGFGVVFLAEQERPVRRKVALKIIKPGMDTRQVIARFEAERQALAMMEHPNIAKVHDAGATENGRPYFVMELVQGVPITEYCDQCNLPTRERLELFKTVCQAVQHAHQKGIIHRDIKPTNVLVAMQDGRPAPKIIDFGVAKAVNERLTEQTLATGFAQMIGTPMYMSPEQAELSPMGVDTRSDIYSLGVLLYELLTGTTPFDKDRLHSASYDELRRIIREEEPPHPSARLSSLPLGGRVREGVSAGETAALATTIAAHRRTDPRRLVQSIRGELDWIVMKCLEKDRNRRYETPNDLARDIEGYLHDEPVQACPPSKVYRLRKFARRNRLPLTFVALLLGGFVFLAYGYMALKRERDAKGIVSARAKAVDDLFQSILRSSASGGKIKGSQYTVREMLDDYSAGLGNQLADKPEAEADLRTTIGRTYLALGAYDRAEPQFQRAIELRRTVDGPQHENVAANLIDLGWNLIGQHKYDEAAIRLREVIEIYQQQGGRNRRLIHAWGMLPLALSSSGRHDEAERAIHEAWDVMKGDDEHVTNFKIPHDVADITYYCLSFAYYFDAMGKHQEAADFAHKAALTAQRLRKPLEPAQMLVYVAIARLRLGDKAGYREACAPLRSVPLRFTDDDFNLGCIWICCLGPGAVDDPTLLVREAEKLASHNSFHAPYVDFSLLGAAHYRAGNYKQAAQCLEQSIAKYPSDPPPTHGTAIWPQLLLTMTKWQQGEHDEAKRLLADVKPASDKHVQSQTMYWHRRAVTEILRREAEALIESAKASDAVENVKHVPLGTNGQSTTND
jgi:non-specific serine/threonine protein kinase/serine/threonine-protein kinase